MPVESKNDDFPITLKIPAQKFSKRFHSEDEVRSWLGNEIKIWNDLDNYNSTAQFPEPGQSLGFLRSLTVEPLREALNSSNAVEILQSVERGRGLLSEGKQGLILRDIHANNPELYPGAVATLVAANGSWNNNRLTTQGNRYPLPWSVFMSGLGAALTVALSERSSAGEKRILDKLTSETKVAQEETETLRLDLEKLHRDAAQRFEADFAAQAEKLDKTEKHFSLTLQSRLEESAERISELEQQVRERLILEAPTVYWTKKADSHRTTAAIFGGIFIVALGAGVYWLTHYGVDLVGDAYNTIVGERENPGLLALVPLAFITLPTLAFAWLLRHVSRIIVQNLSLQADAQLRGTIATTYSALVSEPGSTTPELAIALNALFRPVDGSGHAEIAPPNVKDILEMGK